MKRVNVPMLRSNPENNTDLDFSITSLYIHPLYLLEEEEEEEEQWNIYVISST